MSVFFKPRSESRALTTEEFLGPTGDTIFGSSTSLKGALDLLPVYASVRLLATTLSTLPLKQFREEGEQRLRVSLSPSLCSERGHLRSPWLNQAMTSLLLRGNAYGLVPGYLGGEPLRPRWLHPDRVTLDESGVRPVYLYEGKVIEGELIHLTGGVLLPGSVVGVSPIKAAAMAVETGHEVQKFSRDWFRNKAMPSAIFKNTGQVLDPEKARVISDGYAKRIQNGKPLVYGSDWDYTSLKVSAEDAAFLKASRATSTMIATIFGVPPEMVGGESSGSLTYSTVEQNMLNFITLSLGPWLVVFEEAIAAHLTPPGEKVKFVPEALVRMESKAKYEIYEIQRRIGMRSVDDLRALDDEPPLPDGQGRDYTPLQRVTTTKTEGNS